MAGFDRQRIIDGYLAASGRNIFVPAEFVDWLAGQPEHEAYDWFFASGDAVAAREHRIAMARQMANGLRITAPVSIAPTNGRDVRVEVREFPALISPVGGRHGGGGYVTFDPADAATVAELRRQGAVALRTWLARYRGVMEMGGIDVSQVAKIAARIDGGVAVAA